MSEKEPQSNFLNRWSSRKLEAAVQVADEDAAKVSTPLPTPVGVGLKSGPIGTADSAVTSGEGGTVPAVKPSPSSLELEADVEPEELILSDADMPPIESLTADSDVSAFFNKGVSAAVRKAALRFVFQQPKFNVRDGLNDYDGDYTVFEPLGDTITSDMKFHAARKERDRLAAQAEAEREEKLRLQQQSEDETEASKQDDKNDEDASDEEALVEDEPSSQPDSEDDVETDSGNEVTQLAHAEVEGELNQQAQTTVEKIEQV